MELVTIAAHCSKGTMMCEAFRQTLSALREQLASAADQHPDLYFEEVGVSFEGDGPQEEMWKNFIAANRGEDGKERWHISKRANACGRFYGDVGGIEEFKRLAESLDLVLPNWMVSHRRG